MASSPEAERMWFIICAIAEDKEPSERGVSTHESCSTYRGERGYPNEDGDTSESFKLSLLIDGSGFAGKSVEVSALAVSATGSSSLLLPFVRLEGAFPPLAEGVQSSDQPTSTPTDPLPEAALLLDLPPTLRSSVQGSA